MVSATFFPFIEFGWLGVDHWHNLGAMRCAASTFVPRAALTCACVRREQASLAGAAYAEVELHAARAQRKVTAAEDKHFRSIRSPRVGIILQAAPEQCHFIMNLRGPYVERRFIWEGRPGLAVTIYV